MAAFDWRSFGTLVAGVLLVAGGLADGVTAQHLTLTTDMLLIVAGAGALGVHVDGTSGPR